MATTPVAIGSTGMPQAKPSIAHGPDNPQIETSEQQEQRLQLPDGYEAKIVETITTYRTGWAPDRLLRIPGWMRNVLMFRGSQLIEYDPSSNTYVDVIAYNRANGKAQAEDTCLEKYSNNITQMLEGGFSAVIAGEVPSVIVKPENAEILADVTTAKASQEAISIIERMNGADRMLLSESNMLYLWGVYFKQTRAVLDGDWAGWDYEDTFGSITVTKPDRYHCFNCGTDTPAQQFPQGQAKTCPKCGAALGPESFYPAEQSQQIARTGQRRVPRAMVKWDVHGPMEIDVDPMAQSLSETAILSFDREIDIGALRLTYPAIFERITDGAEVGTTPNASYERLRRNEVTSMGWGYTSDSQNQKPTLSMNWMQPSSYGRIGDKQFSLWMQQNFPDGAKVTLIGTVVADIRKANLTKEWTACKLHQNVGMYPESIADLVVPFNIRLNDVMDEIDDWMQRCAAGMTIYDSNKIDRREMAGRVMSPGVLNGVQTKGAGVDKPLAESIMQFKFELDPQVFQYPPMLIQMAETISGVTPQTFGGGGQEGIETASGQKQSLNTALSRLNVYWKEVKYEHSQAAQNALECLQKLMEAGAVGELWDVVQANGSEFRNNYVNWNKMQGHIKVYQDVDQGLPQTPEQIRETLSSFVKMANEDGSIAKEMFDCVPNQEMVVSILGPPGAVLPQAAQRSRTLQAINTLMENNYIAVQDPQTGQQVNQLPVVPEKDVEDFPVLRDTMRLFWQENGDYKKSNPGGWQRTLEYYQMALELEAQAAAEEAQRSLRVKQAGTPPPPPPNPTMQAAQNLLLQDAADEVENLQRISHLPPLGQNGSEAAQVSAGGKILDMASKLAASQNK
jgi:hypothetical protein